MEEKTFYENERPVKIKISNEYITFHFPREGGREFYWIDIQDWKQEAHAFPEHMERKNWFVPEMRTFIDDNIKN